MIQQSYRLTEQNKHHGDEKQKNPSLLRRLFGEKL